MRARSVVPIPGTRRSKRWSGYGDARFTGTSSEAEIDVKPLVVSFGLAYHF